MDLEHIAEKVREGRLVAVTFLSTRGRVESEISDHPCDEARVKGERFAFYRAFASCAHAIDVERVEETGDEVFLHGRTGGERLRVRISPVWLDEQREILARWRKDRIERIVEREFRRVLE